MIILDPCKNCGMPIDRPKGATNEAKYCLRRECVLERKRKQMKAAYYEKTGRPELARYVMQN